jgi:ankyrin repeat protein
MAAIVDSPACLEMLLRSQAEPNLPDLRGMLPIHHAMCVETAGQVEAVDILLEWGADVLQRDYDGESAFSLASSGSCVAACMDQCWKQLTMLDIVHRQSEDLVGYLMGSGCLRELRQTCWVLRKCFEFRGLSAEDGWLFQHEPRNPGYRRCVH